MPNLRDHSQVVSIAKALTGRLNFLVLDTRETQAKSVGAFSMSIPFTYLYLIYDPFTQFYKIGKSDKPGERHKQLCSPSSYGTIPAAPTDYQLLAAWLCPESAEKEFHTQFESVRVRGEWFDLAAYYSITEPRHEYDIEAKFDEMLSRWARWNSEGGFGDPPVSDNLEWEQYENKRLKGYVSQLEAALFASRLCGGEMPKALLPAPQSEYQF
jgi:hypothetical protein